MPSKVPRMLPLLLLAACAAEQGPEADLGVADTPPTTITLRIGDEREFSGVLLTFLAVANDSRCPSDVQCVWAGDATVELGAGPAAGLGPHQQLVLHPNAEPRSVEAMGLRVTLLELRPTPRAASPIPQQEYEVNLRVVGLNWRGP